jgi:hypothetical protein
VLFEYNYGHQSIDYLPEYVDFKAGKLYPNDRPGLGVTLDPKPLTPIGGRSARTHRGRLRYRAANFNDCAITSFHTRAWTPSLPL